MQKCDSAFLGFGVGVCLVREMSCSALICVFCDKCVEWIKRV